LEDIPVVILCGGLGTRLREETEFRPKPMVEIGGRPILWHIMRIYAHWGFHNFILCLGYRGEVIKEYFLNYDFLNNDFTVELGVGRKIRTHDTEGEIGWRVTLADTGENSMKGSRIKQIEKYIEGDIFMLTYGDGVIDLDLRKLLRFHLEHGRIGTITGVRPLSRFGELIVDGNRVSSFTEKPQSTTGLINGGFFVFNRAIFDYLTEEETCDFEIGALEQLAEEGQLMVFKHAGEWACMDTYRDMEYLNRMWREGKAFWKVW
jgi:glucose-1-phosphate cytidylyltransferase